jgi:hypothetical protein
MDSKKYIGMDVHKESISIAVMNGAGKIVMECVVETKASMILQFINGLRGDLQVTEEGTSAAWLCKCPGEEGEYRGRGEADGVRCAHGYNDVRTFNYVWHDGLIDCTCHDGAHDCAQTRCSWSAESGRG